MSDIEWAGKTTAMREENLKLAQAAAEVLKNYEGRVTLRQVYYRLVAANVIVNSEQSYKRLGRVVKHARECGIISWDDIEDRTRTIETVSVFDSPEDLIEIARRQFDQDRWINQKRRVAVVVEKSALAGVVEPVCRKWQVPFCAARGDASSTLVWEMAQTIPEHVVIYLGDHDPRGVNMSENLPKRLDGFNAGIYLFRLALDMDQIEQHQLPPQDVKATDKMAPAYIKRYGHHCWELDALDPDVLTNMVDVQIQAFIDHDAWHERDQEIEHARQRLVLAA